MGETFLLIYFGEDGCTFQRLSKSQLTEFLNNGEDKTFVSMSEFPHNTRVTPGRGVASPELGSYLLIRDALNAVAVPQVKQTVTVWELP